VQAGRRHSNQHVAGLDPVRAQYVVGLDDADAGGRDVVVVGRHQAGVLGGLPAQQRATGHHAPVGDASHQFRDPLGHRAPHGDVVLQKQRFGAADHEVVDHHRDEVDADGVVLVHRLGDRELGANAIGRGRQHRFPIAAQCEQPGESTQPAADLGSGGLVGQRFQEFDGAVAGFDVDPGRRVGDAGRFGAFGHRDQGYR
jgi:hypothetical protein